MKFSIITYCFFAWIKITWLPDASLTFWLFIAMVLDFLTGYYKAYAIGEDRTSSGIRKTVVKLIQYLGALVLVTIFQNINKEAKLGIYLDDGVIIFILFAETVSILENLIAISPESPLTKFLFKPLHALLTLAIKRKGEGLVKGTADMVHDASTGSATANHGGGTGGTIENS